MFAVTQAPCRSTTGMVLHLDARTLAGAHADGDVLTTGWDDVSGRMNHADNAFGAPVFREDSAHGHPFVQFSGTDLLWTTKDFQESLPRYTVALVAR